MRALERERERVRAKRREKREREREKKKKKVKKGLDLHFAMTLIPSHNTGIGAVHVEVVSGITYEYLSRKCVGFIVDPPQQISCISIELGHPSESRHNHSVVLLIERDRAKMNIVNR